MFTIGLLSLLSNSVIHILEMTLPENQHFISLIIIQRVNFVETSFEVTTIIGCRQVINGSKKFPECLALPVSNFFYFWTCLLCSHNCREKNSQKNGGGSKPMGIPIICCSSLFTSLKKNCPIAIWPYNLMENKHQKIPKYYAKFGLFLYDQGIFKSKTELSNELNKFRKKLHSGLLSVGAL